MANIINFLKRPDIEVVLLTAFLGLFGWILKTWYKKVHCDGNPGGGKQYQPKHQLPHLSKSFTGRDKELAEIKKQLKCTKVFSGAVPHKHLALHGMGGVGKTALAAAFAHRLKKRFERAQIYVTLRGSNPENLPPLNPAVAMQTIINTLSNETKLPDAVDQLQPIYNSVLNDAGNVLLFLDDAANAEQIRPLLPPANCFALITSRNAFSLPETVSLKVDCLTTEESRKLLLKLAPRLFGSETEAADLCSNLPLALEVLSGLVNDKKMHSVSELLRSLREKIQRLAPVEVALQLSFDLLPENLRLQWASLSIFSAPFDLAAAADIWEVNNNAAREAMHALVSASLVEWNEGNDRFQLHGLVYQFCNTKLNQVEIDGLIRRFTKHYRDKVIATEDSYRKGGDNVARALNVVDHERNHIEKMFELLRGNQNRESAVLLVSLLDAMANILDLRFHPRQRGYWLEGQLIASRLLNDRTAECKSLGYQGIVQFHLGNVHKAIALYEQALSISLDLNYRRGESAALSWLGLAEHQLGNDAKALNCYQRSIEAEAGVEDPKVKGRTLNLMGCIYRDAGDYNKAIESLVEALSHSRICGDRRGEAAVLANLGHAYVRLDDIHSGIHLLESALSMNGECGDWLQKSQILCCLGQALGQLGREAKAIECHDDALHCVRKSGNVRGEGLVLSSLAVTLVQWGDANEAVRTAEKAVAMLESVGDPFAEVVRDDLSRWRKQLAGDPAFRSPAAKRQNSSPSVE